MEPTHGKNYTDNTGVIRSNSGGIFINKAGILQKLMDNCPIHMFSVGRDYCYLAFNQQHAKEMLARYGQKIDIGANFVDSIPGSKEQGYIKNILERVWAGENFLEYFERGDENSKSSHFEMRFAPIMDAEGAVVGASCIWQDLPSPAGSRLDLLSKEDLFQNLFDRVNSVTLILDPKTFSVIEANRAACAFYGYSHDELTRLKISDLTEINLAEIQTNTKKFADGSLPRLETRHRLSNGEWRNVEVFSGPVEFLNKKALLAVIHDITERKYAEKALKDSEERFRFMLEASFDVYYRRNLVTDTYDYLSPALEKLTGHKPDEMKNLSIEETLRMLHPDDVEIVGKQVDMSILEETGSQQVDYRLLHKDGTYRWLSDLSQIIRDEKGNPLYREGAIRDITARKQAELILRESEERYRRLVEISPDVVYRFSSKKGGIYYSPHISSIFGHTAEEMLAHPMLWHDSIHPDDLPSVDKVITNLSLDTRFDIEYRIHDKLGVEHWLEDRRTGTLQQGDEIIIEGLVTDITQRKHAERQLIESQQRYRTLFEDTAILIWEEDFSDVQKEFVTLRYEGIKDWRDYLESHPAEVRRLVDLIKIRDVNTESLKFFQAEQKSELIHKLSTYLLDESWPAFTEEMIALAEGKTEFETEVAFLTLHGEHKEMFVKLSVPQNSRESLEMVIVSFVDISARKAADAALQSAHVELEERVRDRTEELQSTNLALDKALRARDEFLATMSHELRTPLTGVLSLSQILIHQLRDVITDKQMNSLLTIEQSGKRLNDLINDVLSFSSLQAGMLDIHSEKFSLDHTCLRGLNNITNLAREKHQEFIVHIEPEMITMNSDERLVKQILSNLLSNAIKFTPDGGLIELNVNGIRALNQVTIRVTDSGIGIKPEDFHRLFQPFVQLDARLSRSFNGTGLGLALVKNLTTLLGGKVEFESAFGQGTTFTVTLPWVEV